MNLFILFVVTCLGGVSAEFGFNWMEAKNTLLLPSTCNPLMSHLAKDRSPVYVGRAHYKGQLLPASVIPAHGKAYVTSDGKEVAVATYEFLCAKQVIWVATSEDALPEYSVDAGYTRDGEILYIGRVMHKKRFSLGKVQPSEKGLFIAHKGKEMKFAHYEALVYVWQ